MKMFHVSSDSDKFQVLLITFQSDNIKNFAVATISTRNKLWDERNVEQTNERLSLKALL